MSVLYQHIQTVWPMPDISPGTMGGSSMRSAIGPEKTGYSRRNCGDIRHLALGSNYAFIYALDIERETDSAPALIQVSLDTGKADPLYVSGIAVGNYIVSDIGLQGKILCADGDALYFAATKEGSSQIYKLSASGEPLCLTLDPGSIEQLDVRAGRIVLLVCAGAPVRRSTSWRMGNK